MNVYLVTRVYIGYVKRFNIIIGIFTNKTKALNFLKHKSINYLNKHGKHVIQYDKDLKQFGYVENDKSAEVIAPYSYVVKPLDIDLDNSNLITNN